MVLCLLIVSYFMCCLLSHPFVDWLIVLTYSTLPLILYSYTCPSLVMTIVLKYLPSLHSSIIMLFCGCYYVLSSSLCCSAPQFLKLVLVCFLTPYGSFILYLPPCVCFLNRLLLSLSHQCLINFCACAMHCDRTTDSTQQSPGSSHLSHWDS